MSIRIEITGENPQEIAQSLLGMAFMIAPKLAGAVSQPVVGVAGSAGEAVTAETVQPARKPRQKKADAPVIEHEEKENADVPAVGGAGSADASGDAAGSTAGADQAADGGPGEPEAVGATAANDASAEVDDVAEDNSPAPKDVVDPIRSHVINDYLNVVTDDLPKRKELYGELLAEFDIPAITALRVSQVDAFKAAVDARIEAAVVGK